MRYICCMLLLIVRVFNVSMIKMLVVVLPYCVTDKVCYGFASKRPHPCVCTCSGGHCSKLQRFLGLLVLANVSLAYQHVCS